MGNPVFRFTLSHSSVGTKVISEPIKWPSAKPKLERHPDFDSLVEYFEGDFIFYGTDGVLDGGINFILDVENRLGYNTELKIFIDVSWDDSTDFEPVFIGQLELKSLQHLNNNRISIPIVRDSLWAKFIARRHLPVDLGSTTDLDGNTILPVEPIDINLPSQKIRKSFYGYLTYGVEYESGDDIDSSFYEQYAVDKIETNEFSNGNFGYSTSLANIDNQQLPEFNFVAEFAGAYTFDIQILLSHFDIGFLRMDSAGVFYVTVYIQVNDDTPISFIKTFVNGGTFGGVRNDATKYTYSGSLNLSALDGVRVYGDYEPISDTMTGSEAIVMWGTADNIFPINGPTERPIPGSLTTPTYFRWYGDTVYPSSEAKGYLLHDAFAGVIERIVGRNSFYSAVIGGLTTNMRSYASNGCFWAFAVLRGLQIRGYTLAQKPFSISFNDLWSGANPIFNFAFGYDVISGSPVLRLEEKDDHYDNSSVSLNISNVQEISREYDESKLYNLIKTGYKDWQADDIQGNDEHNGNQERTTVLNKKIVDEKKDTGGTLDIKSDFIGGSTPLEVTRRQVIKESKDYRYDNNTFILALNTDDVSPDRYLAEMGENFTSVTGILNASSKYNLRISPARNFLRWVNVTNGCLQKSMPSVYKFTKGEANFSMSTILTVNDGCRGGTTSNIIENADISVTSDYLHLPHIYKIESDLTWQQYSIIRNNRTKPIGVSRTSSNHKKFFIKSLEYEIVNSKCVIMAWSYDAIPSEMMAIVTPEDPTEECIDFCEEERITEDGETRITEEGETRIVEVGDCSTDDTIGEYIYFYEPAELINVYFYEPSEATYIEFYEPEEI